jgi:hypothetical protein
MELTGGKGLFDLLVFGDRCVVRDVACRVGADVGADTRPGAGADADADADPGAGGGGLGSCSGLEVVGWPGWVLL